MSTLGLKRILRFLNGSSLLSQLGETANLKFLRLTFSLSVSNISPHFIAELRFQAPFFFYYFPSDLRVQNWRISLKKLCDHLRKAIGCSSMAFTLTHENPARALLSFRSPFISTFGTEVFRHEMKLSNLEDQEDLGEIEFGTFASMDSEEFRHIVITFRNGYPVLVTLTNLQVKFSNTSKEIIFTKEKSRCIIEGINVGNEIQFQITLYPATFFHDLTLRAERIWLHKINKDRGVICAPIDSNAKFEIYFP